MSLRDQTEAARSEAPPADEVRAALGRVLASPDFSANDRRRAFLTYVVEETLAGRGDRLKGYAIATAVFGRGEAFDPQADPVVRLEAGRLRRDLDGYYAGDGRSDPLRISIPKGGYAPRFEAIPEAPAAAEPGRVDAPPAVDDGAAPPPVSRAAPRRLRPRTLAAAGVLAALVLLAAAAIWTGRKTPGAAVRGPAVALLPFRALDSSPDSGWLAAGLGETLARDLMRFPGFRVYLPAPASAGADDATPERVGYVVDGSVRAEGDAFRVTAQLRDATTGRLLWSEAYDRAAEPGALIALEGALAEEISAALGQPYGPVAADLRQRADSPEVRSMASYLCVLRAFDYRRTFARGAAAPVLACLEEAVERDPGYSDAWAMLGWLHMDAGRFTFDRDPEPEYAKAEAAARHALELDPDSILALGALSATAHYMGDYPLSVSLGRQAASLNPYDPETLAQLGWRLSVRGDFVEGVPLLDRAIARTANPPAWYYHMIAVDLLLKGDYRAMLEVAQRAAREGSPFSEALVAIASAELGDRASTREALDRMAASPVLVLDPALFIRRNGATDEIATALLGGLNKARRLAAGR